MELRFPLPAPVNPPPAFGIPRTSSSSTAVADQRPKPPHPPHPTPAGPWCAHSLGEAEGTMTTLPQRGEGWARGRVNSRPSLQHPFPASATPQPDSEVTAPGTRLEREGTGLLAVPWELADKPLQSPAENRIPPPHHLPNRIKALGSRLEGAGPSVGATAASSLPIPPRRRGRYDQPWRSFPDA